MSNSQILSALVGRTISAIEFVYDDGGYQNLVIKLDDGTWLHAWEHSQAGEMRLKINTNEIDPEEEDGYPNE